MEVCSCELELCVSYTKTFNDVPVPKGFVSELSKNVEAKARNDRFIFVTCTLNPTHVGFKVQVTKSPADGHV